MGVSGLSRERREKRGDFWIFGERTHSGNGRSLGGVSGGRNRREKREKTGMRTKSEF